MTIDKRAAFQAAKQALQDGADVRDVVQIAIGGEPIIAPVLAALDALDAQDETQSKLDAGLRACFAYDGMAETVFWQMENGEILPICCAGLSEVEERYLPPEGKELRFLGWGRWHHGSTSGEVWNGSSEPHRQWRP